MLQWPLQTFNIGLLQHVKTFPLPGAQQTQDSLFVEMMGNGVSRTVLGRVGKAIIYNLLLLWIMDDEPIRGNMHISREQSARANTKVLKYLSSHFGRGMKELLWGILFPNYALLSGLIMRSDQRILTESLICLIDCECHYRITHAPSTLVDTRYWTLHSRYYLQILSVHTTHVPHSSSHFLCTK